MKKVTILLLIIISMVLISIYAIYLKPNRELKKTINEIGGFISGKKENTYLNNTHKQIFKSKSDNKDYDQIPSTENNFQKKRKFIGDLKNIGTFEFSKISIYKWIFREGLIYLLDPRTQIVHQVNKRGEVLNSCGGQGDAPWENRNIRSIEFNGGFLYTTDNQKYTIKKSDFSNNLDYFYKCKTHFWDAIFINDHTYMFLKESNEDASDNFYFSIIDLRTDSILDSYSFRKVEKLEGELKNLNIVYEGHFFRNNNGMIIYLCSRASLFIGFNRKGEVIYRAKTVNHSKLPKITVKKLRNMTYYEREPECPRNYSATIDHHYLYVLSCVRFIRTRNLVLDLYNITNGNYQGSFELPNRDKYLPTDILKLDKNEIWVLYEDMTIVKYLMEKSI